MGRGQIVWSVTDWFLFTLFNVAPPISLQLLLQFYWNVLVICCNLQLHVLTFNFNRSDNKGLNANSPAALLNGNTA